MAEAVVEPQPLIEELDEDEDLHEVDGRKEKKTVTFNLEPEFQTTVVTQDEGQVEEVTTGSGGTTTTIRRTVTKKVTKVVKEGVTEAPSSVRQGPLLVFPLTRKQTY